MTVSVDPRFNNLLTFIAAALSGAAAGFLFHFDGILYLLFFTIALYFVRRLRQLHMVLFIFFTILGITFQGILVLGIYYFIPFFAALILYLIPFLLLMRGRWIYLIIFIIGIPVVQYILEFTGYFPAFNITFPMVDLFPRGVPLNPMWASMILSVFLSFTSFKRGYVPMLILISFFLFIPQKMINYGYPFLKTSSPEIRNGEILPLLNSMKKHDGIILNEYFFPRDMRPLEQFMIKNLNSFWDNNKFLAYGYNVGKESHAALMTEGSVIYTNKHHPIIFVEDSPKEKMARQFYMDERKYHLFVCQDMLFTDAYFSVKKGDIVIVTQRIPLSWGKTFRIAMKRGEQYYRNMGVGIYTSSF